MWFHRFHFLQVVDYLPFAGETAVSLQYHFRHLEMSKLQRLKAAKTPILLNSLN